LKEKHEKYVALLLENIEFCKELEVAPSDCVIFGIDPTKKWQQYNRGGTTNRLCFAKYLHEKQLPIDFAV
jgi:hypothetical protein